MRKMLGQVGRQGGNRLAVSAQISHPFTHEKRMCGIMASIRKLPSGNYRAEVARRGARSSKVFPTKQAAKDWAAREEHLILNSESVKSQAPFGDVMDRYSREVSSGKRGARWEIIRIEKLRKDSIAEKRLSDLRASDLADWRDRRLSAVSAGAVIREMGLLSSILSQARREWGLIANNPMSDVRRPAAPPPRDRMPTADEFERLAMSAGSDLTHATARAYHAFLFSVETAMRAGEVVGLTWDRIDLKKRVARLDKTKSGAARSVPLSSEAVRLLEALPKADPAFGLTSRQIDALWRKLRDRAGVEGLTYHDSRHVAIVRLSRKLDVLALARMVGHRDIRQLQTYYSETAEELAKRLD